jgi:predicted O-linked N-acetylglucosamine transferase (SPINDLY family)
VAPLPMEKSRCCLFASFASRGKVSDAVLRSWARIMGRVEGSRLDLYAFDKAEAARVHGLFELHGVAEERVRLLGRLEIQDYFGAHAEVDILLDTFPLSGHTVICHGLWMGVPAVCLRGKIYWERLGAAVMEWAGLEEFIADSPEEYVEIAVGWAQAPEKLARLRQEMRERMRASPLLDYAGHARRVEGAFQSAWQAWRTPAENFA